MKNYIDTIMELKPKKRLEQMVNFSEKYLLNNHFDILSKSGNIIRAESRDNKSNRRLAFIMVNNGRIHFNLLKGTVEALRSLSLKPVFLFYKNGTDFFVKASSTTTNTSQKHFLLYSEKERENIIALKPAERYAMLGCDAERMHIIKVSISSVIPIFYYQPKTKIEKERIRAFTPTGVDNVFFQANANGRSGYSHYKNPILAKYFFMKEEFGREMF